MNTLSRIAIVIVSAMGLLTSMVVAVPAVSVAAQASEVCKGVNPDTGVCTSGGEVNKVIKTVINLLSWIVGVIAAIMIVIAGLSFATSGGDSEKTKKARSTITYALIGLVVVILAQVIVNFVIKKVN